MKTVLLLFGSLTYIYSFCQDSSLIKRPLQGQLAIQYDFPQTYGISAAVVYPLTSAQPNKTHRNSSDIHLWIICLETAWDHEPLNSSSLKVNSGIGVRISKYPGHYHEWLIEQGFLRTFYQGVVYTIASDGNVKELPGFGRTYATTGFAYVQNWNLNSSDHPVSILVKPSLWIQYPFNGLVKLQTSFQIGARFFMVPKKSFRHGS